ncbi:MAG: FAD-dependent monooxygenase [Pyrinomonadaceae bacterium]|nr:FAD-dependent monooxygenase [Pyrinomonadaceae bacterium]
MSKLSVGIIGGGIGGFTTAVALQKYGIDATIYERAEKVRELGAGMILWVNSARVMNELGLLKKIIEFGGATDNFLIRKSNGEILLKIAIGDFDVPSVCLPRANLLSILVSIFPSEKIKLSYEFQSLEQTKQEVLVRFTNGEIAKHDLLIGADGLRSRVRQQVFGKSEPIYRGYQIWRGIGVANGMPENTSSETWGKGKRFGILNCGNNRFTWYAVANLPRNHVDSANGRKSELLELFSDWHSPVKDLITSTPDDLIMRNGATDQVLLKHWSKGRVVLLGDSAHACTPNLGQGGGITIEDALVLTKCLHKESSVESGLSAYEKLRMARTKHIQQRSRLIGAIAQCENNFIIAAREKITKILPASIFEFNLRRTYSYKT